MEMMYRYETADEVIAAAAQLMRERLPEVGDVMANPDAVRTFLKYSLAQQERELFIVIFLNNQNRVLDVETLFLGSLNQTSVHPREVVKAALRRNAAAVIFAHNHPSGIAAPSKSDEKLTQDLKAALTTVDTRVLDHFVIGGEQIVSFAEKGLL
jgi:DNA repair protein RadC